MLVTGVISIGIKFRTAIPVQRLCTSIKTYSRSSGSSSGSSADSSSDSSSDSDSDIKTKHKIKKYEQVNKNWIKPTQKSRSSNALLDNTVIKESNNRKVLDASTLLKGTGGKKKFIKKNESYAWQLLEATKGVANVLEGNKEDITKLLFSKLQDTQKYNKNQEKPYSLSKSLLKKHEERKYNSKFNENKQSKQSEALPFSFIQELMAEHKKKQKEQAIENLNAEIKEEIGDMILQDNYNLTQSSIFKDMKENTSLPELSTWKSLEQRELELISNQAPRNFFQEMIQWTESGKLWTFPIDNEYGMEEESNVHFSEHIFLERHLKDWCPNKGPIRHYMELVCIGLSKNPYMTVNEKIDHITWYKEYFNEKTELLRELGAIDVTSNDEKEVKT